MNPPPGATPVTLTAPSTLALLAANLVPMAGVLFLGWNIGGVLLVYWGETGVIGLYTLLRIGLVVRRRILLAGPFLILHFGFFMLFCLGIILMIAHEANKLATGSYQAQDYAGLAWSLSPALLAFLVSHGVAFHSRFLGRLEYPDRDGWDEAERWHQAGEMTRALYQHAVPVMGMAYLAAFIVSLFGHSGPLLLIVIALKLAVDLGMHLARQPPPPPSQTCTWKP